MPNQPEGLDDISSKLLEQLDVSPEIKDVLRQIQTEVADAYREGFMQMTKVIEQQASTLNRIQNTLAILVEKLVPTMASHVPPVMRIDGDSPDLAGALVVADPIGAGFTLSLSALSKAVGIGDADASVLIKGFRLKEEPDCAVVVRSGGSSSSKELVNYHPRAVARFRDLLFQPPSDLTQDQRSALKRARKKLAIA